MKKLPGFLKKYFWDTDFTRIDPERSRIYIIRRIMEYGDQKAVAWMRKNYPKAEMRDVLLRFRGLSRKSARFWGLILDIQEEDILCLKRRSNGMPQTAWPF